jgi:hypothetical protein
VTIETERYAVLFRIITTLASRNDVMNVHPAACLLVAKTTVPMTSYKQPLRDLRGKAHCPYFLYCTSPSR